MGANLIDHPGVGVGWEASERLRTETARHADSGLLFEGETLVKAQSTACEPGLWDMHVLP